MSLRPRRRPVPTIPIVSLIDILVILLIFFIVTSTFKERRDILNISLPNAGAIGEQLGMAPATLSFHLAHLARVGLIKGQKESRFIHYSADFAAMDELIAYLTRNCCQGEACLPTVAVGDGTDERCTAACTSGERE